MTNPIAHIDIFTVPTQNVDSFLKKSQISQDIVKKLPGFISGHVYTKSNPQDETHNIITVAVWQDEAALNNAKKIVMAEYTKIGFAPQDIMQSMNVSADRAEYSQTEY